MQNAGAGLGTPKLALASEVREDRFGHETEVHGMHSLAAAFEDEADRRIQFFMLE
jgi:hypothetical protein